MVMLLESSMWLTYKSIKKLREQRRNQEDAVSQQLAADSAYYVQPASALSPQAGKSKEELAAALSIPRLQLVSQQAPVLDPAVALPAAQAAQASQEKLAAATVRYRKAMGKLGFTGGTRSTLHSVRELVLHTTTLDRGHCSSGLLLVQEVTTLLREVGGLVAQILDCLKGAASMEAPRLPLALGEFLEAWVIGSVTGFQNLRHPALLALYWSHPLVVEAPSHPGSYWGSGPRSPASQGKGLSLKDRDNRVAKDVAGDVALADLLELGRLDGQLQDLLVWMARSCGPEDGFQEQSPQPGPGAKA